VPPPAATTPAAPDTSRSPAAMVPVEVSSWVTPGSGHTVTFVPSAASWAATPITLVAAAPATPQVALPVGTTSCPPTSAAEACEVNGTEPPENTGV
jgi:hypothetical protein